MNHEMENTFDSIESAREFIALLTEAVVEAKRDVEADVERESASMGSRRLEALRLTLYNVEKLEFHMNKGRRILNDLRSLRRLLFEERSARPARVQAESKAKAIGEILPTTATSASRPKVSRYNTGYPVA